MGRESPQELNRLSGINRNLWQTGFVGIHIAPSLSVRQEENDYAFSTTDVESFAVYPCWTPHAFWACGRLLSQRGEYIAVQ
jgi:hypothetical protein